MTGKYLALVRRTLDSIFEYRASAFIWILVNVTPLVMLAAWLSLAESGPVAGYSQADFASYYLLLAFVQQMTGVWVAWELEGDIRHGGLAIRLLRPLNPIHDYVAENLADKLVRFILLAPFVAIALYVFPMVHYEVSTVNAGVFLIALAAAWLLRFFSQFLFGMAAFWVSSVMTLHDLWSATALLLGGMMAPLDLFPAPVAQIAQFLPFRYMLSFPVEVALGRLTGGEVREGLATCLFWITVTVLLYVAMWRRGVRQFGAFGS